MIYKAISDIMAEIGHIGKDRRNQQQNFMFRGIDDVMNTMKPLLSKHGVFVVPKVIDMKREDRQTKSGGTLIYSILTIEHHFFAKDGSEVVSTTIGEAMDNGDKASNKAMAIAFKYAFFQVFCIPTEEMVNDDPEASNVGNPSSEKDMLLKEIDLCDSIAKLTQLWNNFGVKYQGDKDIMNAFAAAKKGLQK